MPNEVLTPERPNEENTAMSEEIHVYCIGSDGTEIYAAHSEEEMKAWYRELVGEETATEDLADYFEEITDIDTKFQFNDDGETVAATWRELAMRGDIPAQLSTTTRRPL